MNWLRPVTGALWQAERSTAAVTARTAEERIERNFLWGLGGFGIQAWRRLCCGTFTMRYCIWSWSIRRFCRMRCSYRFGT